MIEKKVVLFFVLGLFVILAGSILAISGSITGQVISEMKRIPQNYTLRFTIKPGVGGVLDNVYVYDYNGNLVEEKGLGCNDGICYEDVSVELYISEEYLGDYYLEILKPNSSGILRQDFYVFERKVNMDYTSGVEGCNENFECGNWSECEISYSLDNLLAGIEEISGSRSRFCKDLDDCLGDRIEKERCVVAIPIYAKKIKWCGETWIEIYQRDTNEILSRIRDRKAEKLPSMDISFVGGFDRCEHCFNGILDGDEIGVDCGGSCDECVDEEFDMNLFQKIMWNLDFH